MKIIPIWNIEGCRCDTCRLLGAQHALHFPVARAIAATALLLFGAVLGAQELPKPDAYEVGVWAVGAAAPFQVTRFTLPYVTCDRALSDPAVDNTPNPVRVEFDDPDHLGRVCTINTTPLVTTLPLGVDYRIGVRAVTLEPADRSEWEMATNTFRRAPRGQPCGPDGTGVEITGAADLNGRAIRVTFCVQESGA